MLCVCVVFICRLVQICHFCHCIPHPFVCSSKPASVATLHFFRDHFHPVITNCRFNCICYLHSRISADQVDQHSFVVAPFCSPPAPGVHVSAFLSSNRRVDRFDYSRPIHDSLASFLFRLHLVFSFLRSLVFAPNLLEEYAFFGVFDGTVKEHASDWVHKHILQVFVQCPSFLGRLSARLSLFSFVLEWFGF